MNGIIVVYDLTREKSLECKHLYSTIGVPTWIQNIKDYASEDVVVFLVGNKSDLTSQRVFHLSYLRKLQLNRLNRWQLSLI